MMMMKMKIVKQKKTNKQTNKQIKKETNICFSLDQS